MDKEKEAAIRLLEQFVETGMSQGAIKNFATLDKLRGALTILKTNNGQEQKTAGGQAGETEKG